MRRRRGAVAGLRALAAAVLGLLLVTSCTTAGPPPRPPATTEVAVRSDPYRPVYHYTPAAHWLNDPNGLVYFRGTYHMFYQHNPSGTTWGNMSWGHATSPDLVHWTEQPVALPQVLDGSGTPVESIFSGSVVVDAENTSGFGTADRPPLVAVYTSAYPEAAPRHAGRQAQSLAYSTDEGRTWTRYDGNPVLDRDSANFRDPKVLAYDGPKGRYWVMAAVEATEHRVVFSRSADLKHWTHLSDFGPAGATGGQWECPDLFPLPVDGDPGRVRWVLVVSLNPGAVAGGSGVQYFVGDFDGTTFTSDRPEPAVGPPPGTPGPTLANLGDEARGTAESTSFTLSADYVDLLLSGSRSPRRSDRGPVDSVPTGTLLFDGFEGPAGSLTDTGWTLEGDFAADRNPSTRSGEGAVGRGRLNTYEGGPRGDSNTGTLTSPAFTLAGSAVSFLLGGGGRSDGSLQVDLLVDDQVVRTATGRDRARLEWQGWDVGAYEGRAARLRVTDRAGGPWGHLTLDQVLVGGEAARPPSRQTTVDLVVDGEVVRSATGAGSDAPDWVSWDVRELRGRSATLRLVDADDGPGGTIRVDQVVLSAAPAQPRLERDRWLDWGRDYYATVSFSNVPDGRRVTLGWMNNWDYANLVPTGDWRGAMTLPRQVGLRSTPDGPRLVQAEVDELRRLGGPVLLEQGPQDVTGDLAVPATGEALRIEATLEPGSAASAGITVRAGNAGGTRIGYDVASGRLFVDRTGSGRTDFHPSFPSVDDAPVPLRDGRITLRVYVDRSSVEVFTQDGEVTLTDQIFPDAGGDRLTLWAAGGTAHWESLRVTRLG